MAENFMQKSISVKTPQIENKILLIRGEKVLLDRDLAILYGVTTSNLNRAVKRNMDRFPEDFMFQVNKIEFENLKFQFGTSRWGGTRKNPYAFTELGVAMLSSVLNSKRAVQVNIQIMRTFVKLRKFVNTHKELEKRLASLEIKSQNHDLKILAIFDTIRELTLTTKESTKKIGFEIK